MPPNAVCFLLGCVWMTCEFPWGLVPLWHKPWPLKSQGWAFPAPWRWKKQMKKSRDDNPLIWVFPKRGKPQNGWFIIMENPMKHGMIWGENPLFSETSIWGTLQLLMVQKSGKLTSWGWKLVVEIPWFTGFDIKHPRWLFGISEPSTVSRCSLCFLLVFPSNFIIDFSW